MRGKRFIRRGINPNMPKFDAGPIDNLVLTQNAEMVPEPYADYFDRGKPAGTFSVSGTLPEGLSLDETTGILTGTPTEIGVTNISVVVANDIGSSSSNTFSIEVEAP